MNKHLQDYARKQIKEWLFQLPEAHQRTFKLLYGRNNGKRTVEDAASLNINDVVDMVPEDRLEWAMRQVESSLNKLKNGEVKNESRT